MALDVGVPMLRHVESVIEPERAPRRTLTIPLAVVAGGFMSRHVLLRAGNISAKRPKDYFRLTGRLPAVSSHCCRAAVAALDDRSDKICPIWRRWSAAWSCCALN